MRSRRIIPARAGFTRPGASGCAWPRDHPRSRGVYRGDCAVVWSASERNSDHPRSRGVYLAYDESLSPHKGSSPLARGLQLLIRASQIGRGIIPARAGFTLTVINGLRLVRDHPRSRGVYARALFTWVIKLGSSPLARGLQHGQSVHVKTRRIIPARAGFTAHRRPRKIHWWDHPRSRGVYARRKVLSSTVTGSSPLARGLLKKLKIYSPRQRIIPARAGFTIHCAPKRPLSKDHPRSRGVYPILTAHMFQPEGSSPLARGLRP